jgi:hypothetical protein
MLSIDNVKIKFNFSMVEYVTRNKIADKECFFRKGFMTGEGRGIRATLAGYIIFSSIQK